MTKRDQQEMIRAWRTKRLLVDGRCLVELDPSTVVLRDLTKLERRYFYDGKVPSYAQVRHAFA